MTDSPKRPWLRVSEELAGVEFHHPAYGAESVATLAGIIELWADDEAREPGDEFTATLVLLTDEEAAALPET